MPSRTFISDFFSTTLPEIILLAFVLLCIPEPALAVTIEGIPYIDEDGNSMISEHTEIIEVGTASWGAADGRPHWYVARGEVSVPERVAVSGDVRLILEDGASLTVSGGIQVQDDNDAPEDGSPNSLTVYAQSDGEGMGALTADASQTDWVSGIGGGNYGDCGSVCVAGGRVTAMSGKGGAGIGGGYEGFGGSVTVTDGIVTVTGNSGGAGIGGGYRGDGGSVTISGGIVTARGYGSGAGIGGGDKSGGGIVTITGGLVTATGGGAGIGVGYDGSGSTFNTSGADGAPGNAVIFAEGGKTSSGDISNKVNKDSWSGVIFEGTSGRVYSTSIALSKDLAIPARYTLEIPQGVKFIVLEDVTLTVAEGATLINEGLVSVRGQFVRDGTVSGQGQISYSVDGIRYLGIEGLPETAQNVEPITSLTTAWGAADGRPHWYVARGEVSVPERVAVSGDVRLILEDGASLTVSGGIQVQDDNDAPEDGSPNSLTVYAQSDGEGMGALMADASQERHSAGIGGDYGGTGGAITILGGEVTSKGSEGGAGIGGGYEGASGGMVTIVRGVVSAYGGLHGSGIGGGYKGSGGILNVAGGSVVAQGGRAGTGIGGGDSGPCGEVTITGGVVVATGGDESAGIGNGSFQLPAGAVTVTGGSVTAQGGWCAAGIGGGYHSFGCTVVIGGGTVTATGGYGGAGIGGGIDISGGAVTVDGGEVTAQGGDGGAGIGGGREGSGGTVSITGGVVEASGGNNAAGIGGGANGSGSFEGSGGTVTISGGSVTATGFGGGAGIGGGDGGSGGAVSVIGGTVIATGGSQAADIGGGSDSYGNTGTFSTEGSDGASGNAVIFATGKGGSSVGISDDSNQSSWSGVIFEGTSGGAYGTFVTPVEDFEIPSEYTLEIPEGATLIISADVTLKNDGLVIVGGELVNDGTIIGSGEIVYNTWYLDETGERQAAEGVDLVLPHSVAWGAADGRPHWYVARGEVSVPERVAVSGDVRLILEDGASLTVSGGIQVQDDNDAPEDGSPNSLTVYAQSDGEGMGALTADASQTDDIVGIDDAGIGGDAGYSSGTVTIYGGSVTATGGRGGSGIGGGYEGAGGITTIAGGRVSAKGGYAAAGIGGGYYASGGDVVVSGGTVTAAGDQGGAGIGGGFNGFAGTFSTSGRESASGNAVVFATGGEGIDAIADKSNQPFWSGVIFEGESGKVYGENVTPTSSFSVPLGYSLEIPSVTMLTLSDKVSLENSGIISVVGAVSGATNIVNLGDINRLIDATELENLILSPTCIALDGETILSLADDAVGYVLPTAVELSDADGTVLVLGSDYDYDSVTGAITFKKEGTTDFISGLKISARALRIPSASDFTFTAPDNLVYDGAAKEAALTSAEGMGVVTLRYFDADGTELKTSPIDAGAYTVKLDVAMGESCAAAAGITDESWAFTIKRAPLTVDASSPDPLVYGDAAPDSFDCTVTGWVGDEGTALEDVLREELSYSTDYKAGFDAGVYVVTVVWSAGAAPEELSNYDVNLKGAELAVGKAAQVAPEGVSSIDEVTAGGNDGALINMPADSEWRAAGGMWAATPEGGFLDGLSPNIYEVRMSGDKNHECSPAVELDVRSFSETHGGIEYPKGSIGEDGEVILPGEGGTLTWPDGSTVTLPGGTRVDFHSSVATTSDGIMVTPDGGGSLTVTLSGGAKITAPSGSTVVKGRIFGPDGLEIVPDQESEHITMYRLYNRYTGEHFYTASAYERDSLSSVGWDYEGVGWTAPASGDPVYRLYNPYAPGGDHHYTTSAHERDALVSEGWSYEGVGWRSAAEGAGRVPLYRQYNPYASTGTHNYTASLYENDHLVSLGWRAEGIAWYGAK